MRGIVSYCSGSGQYIERMSKRTAILAVIVSLALVSAPAMAFAQGNGNGGERGNGNANENSDRGNGGGNGNAGGNGNGNGPENGNAGGNGNGQGNGRGNGQPPGLTRGDEQTALDAKRTGRAVPLEDILGRLGPEKANEVIDAELITVDGFLLYAVKVLSGGVVSTQYFYAQSGLPVDVR